MEGAASLARRLLLCFCSAGTQPRQTKTKCKSMDTQVEGRLDPALQVEGRLEMIQYPISSSGESDAFEPLLLLTVYIT